MTRVMVTEPDKTHFSQLGFNGAREKKHIASVQLK